MGQISPKWEKSGTFSAQISVHLAEMSLPSLAYYMSVVEMSELALIIGWDKSVTFKISLLYVLAHRAKMYWKLILKSSWFILLGINMTQFGTNSDIDVTESERQYFLWRLYVLCYHFSSWKKIIDSSFLFINRLDRKITRAFYSHNTIKILKHVKLIMWFPLMSSNSNISSND